MTKTDLTGGQSWFKIMLKNGFFYVLLAAIAGIIFISFKAQQIIEESGLFWLLVILAIPITTAICVSYFGLYRFWNDLKNGRSR